MWSHLLPLEVLSFRDEESGAQRGEGIFFPVVTQLGNDVGEGASSLQHPRSAAHTTPPCTVAETRKGMGCSGTRIGKGGNLVGGLLGHRRGAQQRFSVSANPTVEVKEGFLEEGPTSSPRAGWWQSNVSKQLLRQHRRGFDSSGCALCWLKFESGLKYLSSTAC